MALISNPLNTTVIWWLRALVTRRTRRRSWPYIIWLVAYLPLVTWVADFLFGGEPFYPILAALIAILAVLVQLFHPTLLGWVVISIPSMFMAGLSVYFVAVTAAERTPEDLAGLLISRVVAGVYVLVCIALWLARPELSSAAVAGPDAAPKGAAAPPVGDSGAAGGPPS